MEVGGGNSKNPEAAGAAARASIAYRERNQGWVEVHSGRTGHGQHIRAEIQGKEGMESPGAQEARESAG